MRCGYVYPVGEALAGILMIAGVPIWIAVPVALFIGTIKREFKCASFGGSSNAPLGFV